MPHEGETNHFSRVETFMRYRILFLSVFGTVFGILLASWLAMGQGKPHSVRASLVGFQEVPAVSTQASGDFEAHIDSTDTQLTYVLQYSGFTVSVIQAHIHFGTQATIGGVSIFLCGTAAAPGPPGTPECPQAAGTVTRTVTAAEVIGPGGQSIAAGEFAEILKAIRAGAAYANVHSMTFPAGEIRGQIQEQQN